MCVYGCTALKEGEVCGRTPGKHFNRCVARGNSFEHCLSERTHKTGLKRCDLEDPCRDDYVCSRNPDAAGGICIPTYFVFQLRVDGHHQ